MSLNEIEALDVQSIVHPDGAYLFLWTTNAFIPGALGVMKAWGFLYSTTAFLWLKHWPSGKDFVLPGFYTCQGWEQVLIGRCGKKRPKKLSMNERGIIRTYDSGGPRPNTRPHSKKPDELYESIERMFGDVPRLEMFARHRRLGWDVFGNQVERSIKIGRRTSNGE